MWQVKNANGSIAIDGIVPGEVHTDLMRAGILGDPYYRFNDFASFLFRFVISSYEWVGRDTWTYSRVFTVDYDLTGKATWIQCEGIDTVAEILLDSPSVVTDSVNSVSVAHVDNQHRTYWIDVSKQVHRGQNSIVVAFANPAAYPIICHLPV